MTSTLLTDRSGPAAGRSKGPICVVGSVAPRSTGSLTLAIISGFTRLASGFVSPSGARLARRIPRRLASGPFWASGDARTSPLLLLGAVAHGVAELLALLDGGGLDLRPDHILHHRHP